MYHIYECILYASCPGQLAFRAQHCIPRPLTVTHPRRPILLLRLGNARFSRERRRHLTGWSRNWMVSTGWSRLHCAIPVVHIFRFLVYLGLSYLEFSQRCVVCCSVLQCVAVCCSVFNGVAFSNLPVVHIFRSCVAVCCSVLQCVAVCSTVLPFPPSLWCIYLGRVVQCVAVFYSVFKCVAFSTLPVVHIFRFLVYLGLLFLEFSHRCVCCSVLQCVAVCCSVLQCVAVCCSSVLQCVAV